MHPDYLLFVLSSNNFQKNWYVCSNGSGNRLYLQEPLFLKTKIPLPTIELQEKIVNQYHQKIVQIEKLENQIKKLEEDIEECLLSKLEIIIHEKIHRESKYNFLSFVHFSQLSNWKNNEIYNIKSKYSLKKLKDILHFVNRSWKKQYEKDTFNYIEIGGIDPNLGIIKTTKISTQKAPSRATQQVKTGDLLIGTTRPYLKKFAIVEDIFNDYICSSGFQVIEKSIEYNLYYILFVLQSDFCIKQFEYFMTGALYPAINKKQLEDIIVPFPPITIQNEIACNILEKKKKIKYLQDTINNLSNNAKRTLQNEIFSST